MIAKIKETSATISAFVRVDGDILNKYKIRLEMGPLPKPPIGSLQCPRVRSPGSADPDDGECMQYGAWITDMTLLLKLYHLWDVTRLDYFRLPRDNEICSQIKASFPAIDNARADEERMRNTAVAFIHSHVLNELESNLYPNYNRCLMAGDPAGLLAVIEDAYIAYH